MGKGGIVMQIINIYDADTKKYVETQMLDDDATAPTNATTVMLPTNRMIDDIHNYVFDGTQWVGGQELDTTTAEHKIIMQQAMTIARIQQMLMQQSKDIAELKGVNK